MRQPRALPQGNISAYHPEVLPNRAFVHHDYLVDKFHDREYGTFLRRLLHNVCPDRKGETR